ncbi:MAG TPA: RagB/SusD family nutrient uptake outer membrane protein [Saprospiraceae bacterium]|nr:RagB/SusD family nutrient uptake outer membrane protein [Saprospiraceae bacterium]
MKGFDKYRNGLICILILTAIHGCNEDRFLNINNENELVAETFYTNTKNFENSLNSVYDALKSLDLFGQAFYIQTLLALPHTADYWNAQCRNEVTAGDPWVYVAWRGWYRVVARANDVLDNAPVFLANENPTTAEAEEIKLIEGQAHFLRALAYFHMVRLWGEASFADDSSRLAVPLHLKIPQTRAEIMKPRATVGQVYNQIIADFRQAEILLPETWNTDNIARASKFAAKAYLGQVYLYMEDYNTSKQYLDEVFQSGKYDLVTFEQYDQIFQGKLEFSKETIFELNYAIDLQQNIWENGLGSGIALVLAPPGRGWSNCTPHGVNIFRFGDDPRAKICFYAPEDSVATVDGRMAPAGKSEFNFTGHSFRKYVPEDYSVYSTNRNSGINFVLLRLSDLYLMYAEILNHTGNDGMAAEFANKVRRRAYSKDPDSSAPGIDFEGLTGTQLRDSIREERFRELFAEGERWYDIVRWKIVREEVLKYNEFKVTQGEIIYQDKDYYYPVPLQEIDNNSNIIPSRGYE